MTDLNITVLGDEGDSNDWAKQRSPRKKKTTPSRQSQPSLDQGDSAETQEPSAGKPRRRNTRSTPSIEIREDTDADEDAVVGTGAESESPELRSIDLNRVSVRTRSMSSKQRPGNTAGHDTEASERIAKADRPMTGEHPKHVSVVVAKYPTPDPSVQDDQEIHEAGLPPPADDGSFDTILESEGFTMIDLESIPSARHFFSSPPETQGTDQGPGSAVNLPSHDTEQQTQYPDRATPYEVQDTKSAPRAIPSYLTLPEGESDISSNVPSSPPVLSQTQDAPYPVSSESCPREITPKVCSSPKLPSPPKAVHPNTSKDGAKPQKSAPPKLAKVVKAGIALQGVLSPKSAKPIPCSPGGTPKERLDNLFEGFDSGTRHELRAGLRFGEELAKRQKSRPDAQKFSSNGTRATVVQCTPVKPTLVEDKGLNVSKKAFTNCAHQPGHSHLRKRSSLCEETNFTSSRSQKMDADAWPQLDMDSQKRRELQWQQEREAVSTEIENASSSQVVVIDSDNEDQNTEAVKPVLDKGIGLLGQDDVDIWCEEAASCEQRSSKIAAKPVQAHAVKQQRQQDWVQAEPGMPRRSNIPSPWRRGENVAGECSYLTNGDMTGLFYHEPKAKIKFGAAEIDRQKRQYSSGGFDIDRMVGTPRVPQITTGSRQPSDVPDTNSSETEDSDARQLQIELFLDKNGLETRFNSTQVTEEPLALSVHSAEGPSFEHLETASEYTQGESLLVQPPQPIKIPVNFNDSTVSNVAPCLTRSSRSSPSIGPESPRPCTPRSAMKGGRQSLGHEVPISPATRKVVFSTHETRVDVAGLEEQLSMQSVGSSPDSRSQHAVEDLLPCADEERQRSPSQRSGLVGWLLSGSRRNTSKGPLTDGANERDPGWQKTKSSVAHNPPRSRGTIECNRTPSYLLPPSYPSDPMRDTEIPMSTSGNFTNTHFRTLHIIYAKSQRPRFHAPQAHEIRPGLAKLIDVGFEADESQSGLGVFEWRVDETALRVLERFMREVECGHPAGNEVRWGWTEREICERLFRIIVGEEVRREEKAALERAAR